MAGCTLPPLKGRSESRALPAASALVTPLGQALAGPTADHPGQTGLLPLSDARQAFAARAVLVAAATRTLDVQYYIWRNDVTGRLLLQALHRAAERGVRVRLLLDDNGTTGLDGPLTQLDAHPLVEVRLFNPFAVRSTRAIGFLTDFPRANRRMHNKSFTADNRVTIVGGRNVGDEYFGATSGTLFVDLDVLAVGAVVSEVSADFDRYWASDSAYPLQGLLPARAPGQAGEAGAVVARADLDPRAAQYLDALRDSQLVADLIAGRLALHWSRVVMVSDDPRKGLGPASGDELLLTRMARVLGRPQVRVDLISPYFVPMAEGVEAFAGLVAAGVQVRVLTNALESTDVAAVHAGYARRRKALLRAGVKLYEMRRQGIPAEKGQGGPLGSAGSSLHAKTFSVDGRRIFVGSFNFDPRSARLNTELGFVIEAEALAAEIESAFELCPPAGAYEVRLDERGRLYWLESRDGVVLRHDVEPGAGLWRRLGVRLLSWLPIEWLL